MKKCKLCGSMLKSKPLLKLNNMPKAAQHLPTVLDLDDEKGIDFNVLQCPYCGLVQLDAEPVDYYKDVIRASSVSKDVYKLYLKRFEELAKIYNLHGKNVLEVGCGDGTYLQMLNDAGMSAFGVEHSRQLVFNCKEKGLQVEKGFFDGQYNWKGDKVSAVFMFNYLEHLPDPINTLKNINECLEENAIGIVEVPSLEMMLQKKLMTEFTVDHLTYFDEETLTQMLNLCGFKVISCELLRDNYVLSATVRKRQNLNFEEPKSYLYSLIKNIEKYIEEHENIALWGAGHQAFTMLCMIKNYKKIKFIIDSAKFKQELFSPTTHIKILPPEILLEGKIENVLIVAGSYNLEIAQIIDEKYKNIHISLLTEFGIDNYLITEH